MPGRDRAVGQRRGDLREPRFQPLTAECLPQPQISGQPDPTSGLPPANPQSLGHQHRGRRVPQLGSESPRVKLGDQLETNCRAPPRLGLQVVEQGQQLFVREPGRVEVS